MAAGDRSRTVLLGVTGGVAAYKTPQLARLLIKRGYRVETVLTEAAEQFVTPLALEAVTERKPNTDMWEAAEGSLPSGIRHIGLARECDLMLIAPATADAIAKLASGQAPDLLTTSALALDDKPLLVAPSMNTWMWRNPATQENLETLRERGVEIIAPDSGELACGEEGAGRLPDLEELVSRVDARLEARSDLAGREFLITAGGTSEPLDPVRSVTNQATGKLGRLLTEKILSRGGSVTLVHTGIDITPHARLTEVEVETAEQMHEVCLKHSDFDVLVMTAAVADFAPAKREEKVRRKEAGDELTVTLRRTPDILQELADERREGQVLVGTSVTTGDALETGREKLVNKGLDGIASVQIPPGDGGPGDQLEVAVLWSGEGDSAAKVTPMNRDRLADVLLEGIAQRTGSTTES